MSEPADGLMDDIAHNRKRVADEIAKLDPPDTFEEGGAKYGLGYPEEPKQEEGDWRLRQELAEAHVAANNERAHRQAAEKKIEELVKAFQQQDGILKSAWTLRDEAIKERQDAEAALRSALRLTAFLIKDILRGMPE